MLVVRPAHRRSGSGCFLTRTKYGLAIRASAANPDAAPLCRRSASDDRRRSCGRSPAAWPAPQPCSSRSDPRDPVGSDRDAGRRARPPAACVSSAALIGGMVSIPLHGRRWRDRRGARGAPLLQRDRHPGRWSTSCCSCSCCCRCSSAAGWAGREQPTTGAWSFSPRSRPVPDRAAPARLGAATPVARGPARPRGSQRSSRCSSHDLGRSLPRTAACCSSPSSRLSVTVLTGWAGQLSLGQFAFVGIGGFSDRVPGAHAGRRRSRSRSLAGSVIAPCSPR